MRWVSLHRLGVVMGRGCPGWALGWALGWAFGRASVFVGARLYLVYWGVLLDGGPLAGVSVGRVRGVGPGFVPMRCRWLLRLPTVVSRCVPVPAWSPGDFRRWCGRFDLGTP